jgi:hypothetical protein
MIKAGDKVVCVEADEQFDDFAGEVNKVYTVKRAIGTTSLDLEKTEEKRRHTGVSASRFKLYKKEKAMPKFKVGDRVKLVKNEYGSSNTLGFVGYITEVSYNSSKQCYVYRVAATPEDISLNSNWSYDSDLEAYPEIVYEDEWRLNTGAVEIPDDADKAWNSDKTSIVAFRYVKKPKVEKHTRFVKRQFNEFFLENSSKYAKAKLTFTTTDGELTDIQWEKL